MRASSFRYRQLGIWLSLISAVKSNQRTFGWRAEEKSAVWDARRLQQRLLALRRVEQHDGNAEQHGREQWAGRNRDSPGLYAGTVINQHAFANSSKPRATVCSLHIPGLTRWAGVEHANHEVEGQNQKGWNPCQPAKLATKRILRCVLVRWWQREACTVVIIRGFPHHHDRCN